MALRKFLILRACDGIGLEHAISNFSTLHPGAGRDPFLRHTEASSSGNTLPMFYGPCPRHGGPRPFAGVVGWMAEDTFTCSEESQS
jgi:hypothetical protein